MVVCNILKPWSPSKQIIQTDNSESFAPLYHYYLCLRTNHGHITCDDTLPPFKPAGSENIPCNAQQTTHPAAGTTLNSLVIMPPNESLFLAALFSLPHAKLKRTVRECDYVLVCLFIDSLFRTGQYKSALTVYPFALSDETIVLYIVETTG